GVAAFQRSAVHVQARAARQTYAQTVELQKMSDQAGHGGFAVASGHTHDRNAALVAVWKQVVDNRMPDRLGLTFGRTQVHQQAGARVYLDQRTALFFKRAGNVASDQIDAGNVEADDTRGQADVLGNAGVYLAGDVKGDIA